MIWSLSGSFANELHDCLSKQHLSRLHAPRLSSWIVSVPASNTSQMICSLEGRDAGTPVFQSKSKTPFFCPREFESPFSQSATFVTDLEDYKKVREKQICCERLTLTSMKSGWPRAMSSAQALSSSTFQAFTRVRRYTVRCCCKTHVQRQSIKVTEHATHDYTLLGKAQGRNIVLG